MRSKNLNQIKKQLSPLENKDLDQKNEPKLFNDVYDGESEDMEKLLDDEYEDGDPDDDEEE